MEVLLLFSIIFVILFFYITRNIITDFYKKNIHFNNYWSLCIIFSFWPAKGWLWYAIELKQDIFYISKKLSITESAFHDFIKSPIHHYTKYKNWDKQYKLMKKIQEKLSKFLGRSFNKYS
mgnify:CR=1 FL=1